MTENNKYRARKQGEGVMWENSIPAKNRALIEFLAQIEEAVNKREIERIEIALIPAAQEMGADFLVKKMRKAINDYYSA